MSEILQLFNEISEVMQPYLNRKYFLCLVGSIFLFGIVGQCVTVAIYGRLIKKAENMVSPKNKMLKQLKMKFENCIAVNGVVANPTLMVERYINKYRLLGMSLGGYARITNVCAVLCLCFGGTAGFIAYEMGYDRQNFTFYVLVGCFLAAALDMLSRSTRIDVKEGELICIITDFLVNTLNVQERRQERTANTLKMMAKEEAKENSISNQEAGDRLRDNNNCKKNGSEIYYRDEDLDEDSNKWEIVHKELDDEEAKLSEIEKLKMQEYIINEVLAEFL